MIIWNKNEKSFRTPVYTAVREARMKFLHDSGGQATPTLLVIHTSHFATFEREVHYLFGPLRFTNANNHEAQEIRFKDLRIVRSIDAGLELW